MQWNAPPLSVVYGAYIKPDVAEQLAMIQLVQLALGGGPNAKEPIITRELAVQAIKQIFGIENVPAILEAIDDDNTERQQKAVDNAKGMADALPKPEPIAPGKTGAPAQPAAKQPPPKKP